MIRLRTNDEPVWLDLGDGLRVLVTPLGVAGQRAAEFLAAKAYSRAKEKLGIADDAVLTDQQSARLEGAYTQGRIEALAAGILQWEGVGDDGDVPLPVDDASRAAFAAHPQAGPAFAAKYQAPVTTLVTEGNGSVPAGDGGTPAKKSTARAARPAARRARA